MEVVSGKLELKPDGTYEELTDVRMGGTTVHSQLRGDWRASGEIVELLDRYAGLPFVGYWRGSSLEVKAERAMTYVR